MNEGKIAKKSIIVLFLVSFLMVPKLKAADATIPVVTAFIIPATSNSLTISISTLTATDDTGVTGFYVSESEVAPDQSDGAWIPEIPATYTFATQGSKTLYAWAKDAAGKVSALTAFSSASVVVTISVSAPAAPVGLGVL